MKLLPLFFALLCAAPGTRAYAATYNFYFNNTEQGANSKAAPALTVQEGAAATPAPEAPATPAQTTAAPTSTAAPSDAAPTEFPDAKWRFSAGLTRGSYKNSNDYEVTDFRPTYSFALTYYALPELGLSLRVGRLLGGEIELSALRARTGWGKLQLGLLLGVFRDRGVETSGPIQWRGGIEDPKNSTRLFVGGLVGLNILRNVSLSYAYRISPVEVQNHKLAMSELSLSYLF